VCVCVCVCAHVCREMSVGMHGKDNTNQEEKIVKWPLKF